MIINSRGKIYEFESPIVMGILNLTNNSFYDGGAYLEVEKINSQIHRIVKEGAEIIDVGALSSKPGSTLEPSSNEIEKLIPVIKYIKSEFPDILISIDTFRTDVLIEAHKAGADILNDISGGSWDNQLLDTVANLKMPYILMHILGSFSTMHDVGKSPDLVMEMLEYFSEKLRELKSKGINDIIVDPGFGFSKTLENNYEVLNKLSVFKIFEKPVLAGISRKSMICKVLKLNPDQALNGTTALNMIALLNGANILRVHDVKEAKEVIKLYSKISNID